MPEPYIGITGFKTREQVNLVLPALSGPRKLMVGVLASQKTIIQGIFEPDSRSPKRDDIEYIFPPGDDTINLVHYYTNDQTDLTEQINEALYYGGPNCHGLQLNIVWPNIVALRRASLAWSQKLFVVQLGGRRWNLTDYPPRELSEKVLDYDGVADYVLLDPSGGLGKDMDVAQITQYLESLDARLSVARRPMSIAIAGGLSADNLESIRPLCEQFSGLSFDAEGKLHNGPGRLDLDHCRRYLMAASALPI